MGSTRRVPPPHAKSLLFKPTPPPRNESRRLHPRTNRPNSELEEGQRKPGAALSPAEAELSPPGHLSTAGTGGGRAGLGLAYLARRVRPGSGCAATGAAGAGKGSFSSCPVGAAAAFLSRLLVPPRYSNIQESRARWLERAFRSPVLSLLVAGL